MNSDTNQQLKRLKTSSNLNFYKTLNFTTMHKLKLLTALASMMVIIGTTGCKKEEDNVQPTATIPTDLVGSWTVNAPNLLGEVQNYTMDFKSDGSYSVDLSSDGIIDAIGNFSVTNGQYSMSETSGEIACAPNMSGVYTYVVNNTKLNFTLVRDNCEPRKLVMVETMTKK